MEINAATVSLPHAALPGANWADRWTTTFRGQAMTASQVAEALFARPPRWIRRLMELRNTIVGVFGLKGAGTLTGATGGFPVVSESPGQIVLGFDDRHLDFRIVLDVSAVDGGQQASVTTLVDRHNLAGRLYILVVTPFHRLIVRTMLRKLAAFGSTIT